MGNLVSSLRHLLSALGGDAVNVADSMAGRLSAILHEVEGAIARDGAELGERVTRIVHTLEGLVGRSLEPAHIAHITKVVMLLEHLYDNRVPIRQTATIDAAAAKSLLTDLKNLDFSGMAPELRVILTSLQSLLDHLAPPATNA